MAAPYPQQLELAGAPTESADILWIKGPLDDANRCPILYQSVLRPNVSDLATPDNPHRLAFGLG